MVWFKKGLRHGVPIALGYFAVSFTLGIAAKRAGLTALNATVASLTNNASAGQYAGFTLIASGAKYIEMAIMILVVNARYLLMSCALSQKLDVKTPLWQRMLLGYGVTDEIFGISVSVPGKLNPYYSYGAFCVACPGWAAGTCLGVIMGNILPANVVSALSVGLYGMFLAIIIPPARKNKILSFAIIISMAASFLFDRLPVFDFLSSGMKIIILTVVIALIFAVLFPVKEEENES